MILPKFVPTMFRDIIVNEIKKSHMYAIMCDGAR